MLCSALLWGRFFFSFFLSTSVDGLVRDGREAQDAAVGMRWTGEEVIRAREKVKDLLLRST